MMKTWGMAADNCVRCYNTDLQPTVHHHPLLGIGEEHLHAASDEIATMHQGQNRTGGALFDWSISSDAQFRAFRL